MIIDNPILVEVRRGGRVESRHRGSIIACRPDGEIVFSCGDVTREIYPRSALKIFQAIPLIESGAAARFNLTAAQIALACASHNAEKIHTETVHNWLRDLQLSADDLECGAAYPMHFDTARSVAEPSRVHHNCSGKHAAMLTVARAADAVTAGYSDYDHPVQNAWMSALSEWLDADVFAMAWERDGCGLPAICMPQNLLATAFAKCASPHKNQHADAVANLITAITANPKMLAGTARCCTDVIAATNGEVIIKTGAEGVYAGVIPRLKIGFALKIDDGATRAANVTVGAILKKLNAINKTQQEKLQTHFNPKITNSQGYVTGEIVAVDL